MMTRVWTIAAVMLVGACNAEHETTPDASGTVACWATQASEEEPGVDEVRVEGWPFVTPGEYWRAADGKSTWTTNVREVGSPNGRLAAYGWGPGATGVSDCELRLAIEFRIDGTGEP